MRSYRSVKPGSPRAVMIGHAIAAWREAVGMSRAQLASKLGLRPAKLERIEIGEIPCASDTLDAIARLFQRSTISLYREINRELS